ncbi:O-antigen ligase family protein [Pseudoalteromonas sp. SIMBA_162]|uniref:O-antigen ligase family protein n=1 Tax=Pseudoalteromonas sp. SIMBA_162 TaxID=3080867 RepID=UPI00397A0898
MKSIKVTSFLLCLIIYTLFAVGKILPIFLLGYMLPVNTLLAVLLASIFFYFGTINVRDLTNITFLYIPFAMVFILSSFDTQYQEYAMAKLDGALFFGFISSILVAAFVRLSGFEGAVKSFIYTALVMLFLTVIYKLIFGFFDRNVRFFLNGPIVFGWLMSMAAIASLYNFFSLEKRFYLVSFFILFISVFWTFSKGPILSLLICCTILISSFGLQKKVLKIISLMLLILFLILNSDVPQVNRIMMALDYSNNTEASHGSIGSRLELYLDTLRIISQNLWGGVGLGNWQYYNQSNFIYPHNLILEILSELGVLLGGGVLIYILLLFYKCPRELKLIMLFMFLALQFSGDTTYLYFFYSIPIAGIALSLRKKIDNNVFS